MRKLLTLASAAALILTSMAPAWSADLIGGTYPPLAGSKTPSHHHWHAPKAPKPWAPPRNSFVTVSARYCEDTACEPVTLRIWSGDSLIMHRLGPHEERIRIANIDAPNVIARYPTEAAIAQDAKLQLMSILNGSTFVLARVSGEKDRASTAFVTANGEDVGKRMMDGHVAQPAQKSRPDRCHGKW